MKSVVVFIVKMVIGVSVVGVGMFLVLNAVPESAQNGVKDAMALSLLAFSIAVIIKVLHSAGVFQRWEL